MRALIYKDFKMLGWQALMFYLPSIVVAILALLGKINVFVCISIIIVAEFPISVYCGDVKLKFDKYADVLPLQRQKTVNEKFLMICANAILSLALIEVCLSIGNLVHTGVVFNFNSAMVLFSFFSAVVACGIGLMLMMLTNMYSAIIFMGGIGGLFGGIFSSAGPFSFEPEGRLAFFNNPSFHIYFAIVCILVFAICWIVTLALYKRKDL